MQSLWLGKKPYLEVLGLAQSCDNFPSILGSESPTCITVGRRSADFHSELRPDCPPHIPVYKVDRGGHATLHNPGQLIIYPIIQLSDHSLSVRDYICALGKTTVRLLEEHGIEAHTILDSKLGEPGIYTAAGKIGFIGVRISRGITTHGISLNVNNDLQEFSYIRSCSVWGQAMDSIKEQGSNPSLESLFFQWTKLFSQSFDLTQCAPPTNVKSGNFKPLRA